MEVSKLLYGCSCVTLDKKKSLLFKIEMRCHVTSIKNLYKRVAITRLLNYLDLERLSWSILFTIMGVFTTNDVWFDPLY